ncbi:MAG: hypothetical protein J6C48_00615 [Paludibacteraceae bacterium]|nr:hypothetical protein [Paludibacteraceae bacterium]
MKYLGYILLFLGFLPLTLEAQKSSMPQRTTMDIALKQTKMLAAELQLTDTALCKRIYQMHLKYAQMREISNTREEALKRMALMQEELRHLLSPEQFTTFMNRQLNHTPRTHKAHCNRIIYSYSHDTQLPDSATTQTPPPPPEHQL